MLRGDFMAVSKSIDMTNGPFLKKIIMFAIPLMLTGVLQIVYNAADSIVVGRFVGHEALAGVSSTASLCNLIVGLFMGIAIGSGVVIAKYIGAKKESAVVKSVHTSILFGFFCGIIVMLIGLFFAKPCLLLMGTPKDVIDLSTLYLKIYFLGSPGNLLFNFGASILRSKGDTKRPLIILSVAGIVNVVLNLILVIFFNMSVAGVGIATITAQYISAIWVISLLIKEKGDTHLDIKKLRFHGPELWEIIRIGLPAGLQSVSFALSNVIIQSAINSFGSTTVAGCSASVNIDNILFLVANALTQSAMTFSSQNVGAKRYDNINKVYLRCILLNVISLSVLSAISLIFASHLIGIFSADPAVIAAGMERSFYVVPLYFMCGLMDISGGQLRGMGYSFNSMIISLLGSCVFRLIWIFTILPLNHSIFMLFLVYPISWTFTTIVLNIRIYTVLGRFKKENPEAFV